MITRRQNASKPFTRMFLITVMGQLASALHFLHSQAKPTIHRDISPDNIMVLNYNDEADSIAVVLSDFDTVREIEDTQQHTMNTGKPMYWAPEMTKSHYGVQVDIWSLGVVMIEAMTMQRPLFKTAYLSAAISEDTQSQVLGHLRQSLKV
jgi:serine/threonine protein kinase